MEHLIFMKLLAEKGITHTPEEAKKIFQLFDKMFGRKNELKEVRNNVKNDKYKLTV